MPFCTTCAAPYELGQERCQKCGASLPQPPAPSPPGHVATLAHAVVPPGRLRRLTAGLIDFAICVGLTYYLDRTVIPRLMLRSRFRGLTLAFLLLLLPAAYAVFRDMFGGKSFGKLFTGLTVVNTQAKRRANARDSFLRNVSFGFLAAPLFGWLIFLALSAIAAVQITLGQSTRLGDGMAGTLTLTDRSAEELGV
jgi:hypothetical protein